MVTSFLPALLLAAQPFTIEQVMSAPFASELIAKGNNVAWLQYEQGRRNIYTLRSGKPLKITSYTEDDGQEIGQMSLTPDAKFVVYTRGGDLEMGRETPNPGGLFEKPGQAIWKVSIEGGAPPAKVADGSSPAISAKGEIAYMRGGEVHRDGKKWFTGRGISQLAWSPDGSRMAFVTNRGTHSLIGVTSGNHIQYLDPSVDRDTSPTWSPDGTRVLFIRNAAMTRAFTFGPVRSVEPWSIISVDVATGQPTVVFRADSGPGSAYSAISAESQLLIGADGSIVFGWEKSGWRLLYAVKPGQKARLLTPGAYEVEHVSIDEARKWIYFSSNRDDIDRRHISRVEIASGKLESVTSGTGNEWSAKPLENGAVAFLASDHQTPSHFAQKPANNGAIDHSAASLPSGFPKLQEPKQVIYPAADGMPIHAQVFTPPASFTGKRPAAVFIHGGSRRQMLLGWHYRGYYSNAYALNQYLAANGYVVLSINYRSGIGYGLNFREAENYGATGASEFQDVLGAGLYLRTRPDVDPARIGLWGGSYGGYLTAMGLSRASDLFAAGVDIHGVHDWNNVIRNFVPAYNPQSQTDAAKLAFDSSPMASITTWRSPVLLIHGDDDRNVPFGETVRLVEALRKQGVKFEQLIFPDDVHDFLTHEHFLKAYSATADFLDRHLASTH
jgi:dipeptidyl aminopeptidase/acylaminoacyl peptidase